MTSRKPAHALIPALISALTPALMLALMLALPLAAGAQSAFVSGVHYEEVKPPLAASSSEQIEVVELFWYGCNHCFNFEPIISRWVAARPEDVKFVRVPAIYSGDWEPHARAYYVAEALGILEQTHQALFDAIHVERQPIAREADFARFFAQHGVSESDFKRAWRSFGVNGKVEAAKDFTRRSGVLSVPGMVVDGRFSTTPSLGDGTFESMLRVVDHLVDVRRAE